MCLILFAYNVHPTYKLIVAANRDEFYNRSTAAAHFWEDVPEILAGRDLEKQGTWMGVSKKGLFSALTNYRNPLETIEGKRSRGELVANALKYSGEIKGYMNSLSSQREQYPGYNLLAGDLNELFYYSNISNHLEKLTPGIYGVSNHLLNTDWPKVRKGKEGLAQCINRRNDDYLVENLFTVLKHSEPFPDELLPKTGVSLEWERRLSSLFIHSKDYGTRSSTVLLMSNQHIQYVERIYLNGENHKEQTYMIEYE
ncbi:NRDE family protein [Niallia sp. Krafla_26]|uniref:NRDE family protein n=1 Tax=Niallia sp. Krafla_26 TaxID=3064703 RepID=UPI003D16F753